MGSYFDVALLVILAAAIIVNLVRGFIKSLAPFKKWAALAIAWMFKAPIATALGEYINLKELTDTVYERAYSMWGPQINAISTTADGALAESYNGIFGFLENILLGLKEACAQAVIQDVDDVAKFVSEFIAKNVTMFVLQAVAFIAAFIVLMVVFGIILKLIDLICEKTPLGAVNRLLGGLIGLIIGSLTVWVISILTFMVSPEFIEQTQFALWLAKNFPLSLFFGIG